MTGVENWVLIFFDSIDFVAVSGIIIDIGEEGVILRELSECSWTAHDNAEEGKWNENCYSFTLYLCSTGFCLLVLGVIPVLVAVDLLPLSSLNRGVLRDILRGLSSSKYTCLPGHKLVE